MIPASRNNAAISPILRIFSFRSSSEKPRSELIPHRILSPSKRYTAFPASFSIFSNSTAIVDFPEPDKPVNQTTFPCCPNTRQRSSYDTLFFCQITFSFFFISSSKSFNLSYFASTNRPFRGNAPSPSFGGKSSAL